jgi:hypothetical protein
MSKLWGYSTWLVFHTIAEKIKDEKFTEEKDNIIKYIKSICNNLPCPDCSKHSTETLKKFNFNKKINSKDDLKIFLFEFHNLVNMKRKQKISELSVLNNYEKANFQRILTYWYNTFKIQGIEKNRMADYSAIKYCKSQFIKYIKNNYHKFNWN